METDVLDKIYGKRVVLYGCGRAGKNFYLQNTVYHLCDIVLLADQSVKKMCGREVHDKSYISKAEYDYIVVPYWDCNVKTDIEEMLKENGFNDNVLFIHFNDLNFLSYFAKKIHIYKEKFDIGKMNKLIIDCRNSEEVRAKRRCNVVKNKEIAYIILPKCGCTSIKNCLKESDTSSFYEDKMNISKIKGFFSFTYVRNPFSRLASCYISKYKSKKWSVRGGLTLRVKVIWMDI